MRSDDVIHSFFVPQFRVKQDILPGSYQQLWFTPTKVGTFDLLCAEYCGSGHSKMLATVKVLSPEAFARWEKGDELEDGAALAAISVSPGGERKGPVFPERMSCMSQHRRQGGYRAYFQEPIRGKRRILRMVPRSLWTRII